MKEEIIQTLHNAMEANLDIEIIYNGGSQPGAKRAIHPIKIRGDALVARELLSGVAKTFKLDKIEMPELFKEYEQKKAEKPFPKFEKPETGFQIILDSCTKAFEDMGWRAWKYFTEEQFIGLYKVRKKGAPLKYPEVAISFEEETADMVYDTDSEEIVPYNIRDRQHPWVVSAKGEKTVTYAHFEKALERFMEYADKSAKKLNLK